MPETQILLVNFKDLAEETQRPATLGMARMVPSLLGAARDLSRVLYTTFHTTWSRKNSSQEPLMLPFKDKQEQADPGKDSHSRMFLLCVGSTAVSRRPRRQTDEGRMPVFGTGFEKSPVCHTQLAAEQKEFPAVVGAGEPPLMLTRAVPVLSGLCCPSSWAGHAIRHPVPGASSGIR